MTNQSPSWMRSLARNAASSSTASSASAAASSAATTASSTRASSASATSTTASSLLTATSACSTTSTPCPRSAGWSAETPEVHCSDTLITHFLISRTCCRCYLLKKSLFTEQEGNQLDHQLIESPYVHHDSRHEEDDDAGVSHQLMTRRTNDLTELVQDLADEQGDRPEETAHRVAPMGGITACATGASGACRTRLGHSSSSLRCLGTPC